jgi:hypothetical protein
MTMKPFADDSAVDSIGDLSAENASDAVTLSGSIEITRDKAGLKRAQSLKALVDAICGELEAADLPDRLERAGKSETGEVANPFA